MTLSGLVLKSPTIRSNRQDSHTSGTFVIPTSKPIPRSSRYSITPPAASRPNALPPLSKTAWITSAAAIGFKSSDSLDAGPPPRTSSPAAAPRSQIITVHPVPASLFSALPILMFSISVILISFILLISLLLPVILKQDPLNENPVGKIFIHFSYLYSISHF